MPTANKVVKIWQESPWRLLFIFYNINMNREIVVVNRKPPSLFIKSLLLTVDFYWLVENLKRSLQVKFDPQKLNFHAFQYTVIFF